MDDDGTAPGPLDLPEETYERLRADGFFSTPPAVLARLALSEAAAELSDRARGLVATDTDSFSQPGEWVETAGQLLAAARELLVAAVIAERGRRTSWSDIGEELGDGVSRQAAQERFRVPVAAWEDGLSRPYEGPAAGRGFLAARLPEAALSPRPVAGWLDRWMRERARADEAGLLADRPVSAGTVDRTHHAAALLGETLRTTRFLLDDVQVDLRWHPVAERVQAERKVALYEAMLANDPGEDAGDGGDVAELLAKARARLQELRGRGDRDGDRDRDRDGDRGAGAPDRTTGRSASQPPAE